MALVSIRDLKTYMDISFSSRQEDAAEFVLEGLQSELEAYLGRPIEVNEFTEEYRLESSYVGLPMNSYFYNDAGNNYNTSFQAWNSTVPSSTFIRPPQTVYFKNSPVVEVTEIVVKPKWGDEFTLDPDQDFVVRKFGVDLYYGYADDLIVSTYTAGLAGENIKMFKLMILRAATREMQNMHDDVVGVKDLTTRNVAPLEVGFLEKELQAVKRYRRRRIA
jgi:hypothetical protein